MSNKNLFNSKKALAYAELDIWGESVKPKAISEILNIVPTELHEVGDNGRYGNKPYAVATWLYKTEKKQLMIQRSNLVI